MTEHRQWAAVLTGLQYPNEAERAKMKETVLAALRQGSEVFKACAGVSCGRWH